MEQGDRKKRKKKSSILVLREWKWRLERREAAG